MKVTPVKTHSIVADTESVNDIIDRYIPSLPEQSVLAVTSKIVSLCEGSVVPVEESDHDALVAQEADYYLPKDFNKYGVNFTITRNTMIASAGIDESNGNGNYILWPRNPQQSANQIREHLKEKFKVAHVGVIITDSKTFPLRWGTHGTVIAHSGFEALNNYIGSKDLFNHQMRVTKLNISEGLAAAAVLTMGEGAESTPLAIIEDLPFISFQDRNPTPDELEILSLTMDEDLFGPILKRAPWKKGKKK